jgi:hypothetical protein
MDGQPKSGSKRGKLRPAGMALVGAQLIDQNLRALHLETPLHSFRLFVTKRYVLDEHFSLPSYMHFFLQMSLQAVQKHSLVATSALAPAVSIDLEQIFHGAFRR